MRADGESKGERRRLVGRAREGRGIEERAGKGRGEKGREEKESPG